MRTCAGPDGGDGLGAGDPLVAAGQARQRRIVQETAGQGVEKVREAPEMISSRPGQPGGCRTRGVRGWDVVGDAAHYKAERAASAKQAELIRTRR